MHPWSRDMVGRLDEHWLDSERVGANPFHYLVAVQRHAAAVAAHPERWMPWNYLEAQADIVRGSSEHEILQA